MADRVWPEIGVIEMALDGSVLPNQLSLEILVRLPVETLLRCRVVNTSWCKLIDNPQFIKMNFDIRSTEPGLQAFLIHSLSNDDNHTTSSLNIQSNEKPVNIDFPYQVVPPKVDFVGSCNGLVCLSHPPFRKSNILWNPATRMSASILDSSIDFGDTEKVSIGFGYDAVKGVFKVVKIFCLRNQNGKEVEAQEFSDEWGCWKSTKVDFQFRLFSTKNDALVGGDPYWVARIVEKEGTLSRFGTALVFFDMTASQFKVLPLSTTTLINAAVLNGEDWTQIRFVEWKGSIAALAPSYDENRERVSVQVWVFDSEINDWIHKHTFGPIKTNVEGLLECSKDGTIIGKCSGGKLFVFDTKNGRLKEIVIDETKNVFEIFGFTQSLAKVKGMNPVIKEAKDDEGEDFDFDGFSLDDL